VTQLVTPQLVRHVTRMFWAMTAFALLNLVAGIALVFLLVRVQDTQDATKHVLDDTVAAVRAGSPAAATTRNQIGALCDTFLASDCPHTPATGDPFAPPPTTPSQR
jgi:hypothetical protein